MSGEYYANGSDPTRTQTEGRGNKPPTVQLLVMGPQGCGKSSFINSVTGQADCLTAISSKLCTKMIRSCKFSKWIGGSEFRFIDTPGFGNDVVDNRRIFERLVEYFAPNPRDPRYEPLTLPRRVTGLLYIHSEDEPYKDRASRKAIEMLVKIMGERFLDRVTVLIRSQSKSDDDFFDFTPSEDSPLYPLYCKNIKPWTSRYRDDSESIEQMLGPYIHLYPRLVRLAALDNFALRDGNNWQYDDIPRHLREYFPEDIDFPATTNHQSDVQLRPDSEAKGNEIGSLHSSFARNGKEIQELKTEVESLLNLLAQREEDIKDLQSAHEVELKNIQKDREKDKFNHELGLKRLYTTIQDQEVEISDFKSSKDYELNKLKTLRNEELSKLSSEKDSEIERLQNLLARQEREIQDLRSHHGAGLRSIQKFAHEIEFNCKSLCETIRDQEERILTLKSNQSSGLDDQENLKNEEINKPKEEKDSEIRELRAKLQEKNEELTALKTDSERRIQGYATSALQARENEINELRNKANSTITTTENDQGGEIHRLNEEIRRIAAEYATFRSHMQLEEYTEQADITTALGDINRLIEEFGIAVSEDIEKYYESPPEKALQPQSLLSAFGSVGREVVSKVKQDPYLLLEYAIQATICDQLVTHLFKPFHPSIADDRKRNTFIMRLYEQISQEEPQSISGRWRRDTFNSISKHPTFGMQEARTDERIHRFITGALSALLTKVTEVQPDEVLKKHDIDRALVKVITKAEALNRLLKGGVSILGDFQPIVFHFGEAFQPEYMSTMDSKTKKGKYPETILATLELGLVKRYALGGSQKPQETVLRRAMVFGLPN